MKNPRAYLKSKTPSKKLRQAGFLPWRLAEHTNRLADAVVEAEALNAEVDAWRSRSGDVRFAEGTIPSLIDAYWSDVAYTKPSVKSKELYDFCLGEITCWSEIKGHPLVRSLQREHVRAFYRSMEATPAKANQVIRILKVLLSFAMDEGIIDRNPAETQRLAHRPPRRAIWSPKDIVAFVEAANAMGRPSMTLAVELGANLGQREGDLLRLPWSVYDGRRVWLRQGKTGRLVEVPVVESVRRQLDRQPRISPTVLVSEFTGRPYKASNFQQVFRSIANAAQLGDLRFHDLRRTAVVRLAEAGCSVPEIAAITGHEIDRTARILETYLPRTAEMARNAIARLEDYRTKSARKLEV